MKSFQLYCTLAFTCGTLFIFVFCKAPDYQAKHSDDVSAVDLVHVLFRHGDRTPVSTYPTDPYKDERFWPEGFGQLTNRGKMRSYRLGQYLRRRYMGGVLSGVYSPKEVVARSTDKDRTLSSALCMLAGLYPPRGSQTWNPQLDWQPIPVHTINYTEDALLNVYSYCPQKDEEKQHTLQTPEYTSAWSKHTDLQKFLEEKTGINVSSFSEMQDIYDALEIEDSYGFKLPDWTKSVYPNVLKPLADYWVTVPSLGKSWTKLRAGPLLKEIVEHMEARRNGTLESRRKAYFYAGHDFSIASQMQAMGVWDGYTPPFSAALFYELHKRNDEYFVKILYRDDPTQEPRVLAPRGCSSFCSLDQFLKLVKPMIPDDYTSDCQTKS